MPVLATVEDPEAFNRHLLGCKRVKEWVGGRGSADLYSCGSEYLLVVHAGGKTLAGFSKTLAGLTGLALQAYPELDEEAFDLAEALLRD